MNVIFAAAATVAALMSASTSVPYLPVPHDAAVMLVTSSTNSTGYRIVVQRDGKAEYVRGAHRATAQIGEQLAKQLFADLSTGMPLASLPVARCMKSVSFGTSTFVYWRHSRSPDVSCPGSSKASTINADVQRVATALQLTGLH